MMPLFHSMLTKRSVRTFSWRARWTSTTAGTTIRSARNCPSYRTYLSSRANQIALATVPVVECQITLLRRDHPVLEQFVCLTDQFHDGTPEKNRNWRTLSVHPPASSSGASLMKICLRSVASGDSDAGNTPRSENRRQFVNHAMASS